MKIGHVIFEICKRHMTYTHSTTENFVAKHFTCTLSRRRRNRGAATKRMNVQNAAMRCVGNTGASNDQQTQRNILL